MNSKHLIERFELWHISEFPGVEMVRSDMPHPARFYVSIDVENRWLGYQSARLDWTARKLPSSTQHHQSLVMTSKLIAQTEALEESITGYASINSQGYFEGIWADKDIAEKWANQQKEKGRIVYMSATTQEWVATIGADGRAIFRLGPALPWGTKLYTNQQEPGAPRELEYSLSALNQDVAAELEKFKSWALVEEWDLTESEGEFLNEQTYFAWIGWLERSKESA